MRKDLRWANYPPDYRPVIAVDFDGTIVQHRFPEIGDPLPQVFESLKKLKKAGWRIILWTCREAGRLQQAIDFCYQNGVVFDAINTDLPTPWGIARKPLADFYIDDKNIFAEPMNWVKNTEYLLSLYDQNS